MLGKVRGHLAVLAAGICFSLIGIFIRTIGKEVPIMTLTFLRLLFATLFLAVVVRYLDKDAFRPTRKDLRHYAIIGLILVVNFSLWNASFLYAPVSNVNLIGTVHVIFTFFFASFILKEKVTSRMILAMFVGLLGLVVLRPFQGTISFGNTLALAATAVFGLALVLMKREERDHSLGSTFWFVFFAMLFLLPFSFFYGFGQWQHYLWPLVGLGVLCTGTAYLLLDYGLTMIEADIASLLIMLSTALFAVFFAVTLLEEALTPSVIVGGILLLVAGLTLEVHIKSAKHHIRH